MPESSERRAIFDFLKAVPELGVLPGYVMVVGEDEENGKMEVSITYRVHPPAFPVVMEAIQDPSVTDTVAGYMPPPFLRPALKARAERTGIPEKEPAVDQVLRSLRSPVSEPIQAASDEAAIFELILSAGGQMPRRGQDHA